MSDTLAHAPPCPPSKKPSPQSSPSKPYYYWQERIQSWDFRELRETQKAERPVDAPSPTLMESEFWSMSLPFSLLPPHPSDIPPGAIPALDREVQASWRRAGGGSPWVIFVLSSDSRPQAQRSRTQSCYLHGNNQAGDRGMGEGAHLSPKAYRVVPATQETAPEMQRLVERPSTVSGDAEGMHVPWGLQLWG